MKIDLINPSDDQVNGHPDLYSSSQMTTSFGSTENIPRVEEPRSEVNGEGNGQVCDIFYTFFSSFLFPQSQNLPNIVEEEAVVDATSEDTKTD